MSSLLWFTYCCATSANQNHTRAIPKWIYKNSRVQTVLKVSDSFNRNDKGQECASTKLNYCMGQLHDACSQKFRTNWVPRKELQIWTTFRFPIRRNQMKNNGKLLINDSSNCLNCSKWISNKHRNVVYCMWSHARMWVLTTTDNNAIFFQSACVPCDSEKKTKCTLAFQSLATESIPSIASCSHPKQ